jgi:hypothetical protein
MLTYTTEQLNTAQGRLTTIHGIQRKTTKGTLICGANVGEQFAQIEATPEFFIQSRSRERNLRRQNR